jgi:hypothetical protein
MNERQRRSMIGDKLWQFKSDLTYSTGLPNNAYVFILDAFPSWGRFSLSALFLLTVSIPILNLIRTNDGGGLLSIWKIQNFPTLHLGQLPLRKNLLYVLYFTIIININDDLCGPCPTTRQTRNLL